MLKFIITILFGMVASITNAQSTVINQSPKASVMTGFAVAVQDAIGNNTKFYQSRDCRDAAEVYRNNKESVIVYETMNVASANAKNINCEINFTAEEVVLAVEQHFQFCRLPTTNKPFINSNTLGMSGMHPYKKWIGELNTQNKSNVSVQVYQGSGATLRGIISGEIDYGFVADAVAEKGKSKNQIVCDYTTDPMSNNFIGKIIKHELATLNIKVVVLANKNQVEIRKALNSENFRNYIRNSGYSEIKSQFINQEFVDFKNNYQLLKKFY